MEAEIHLLQTLTYISKIHTYTEVNTNAPTMTAKTPIVRFTLRIFQQLLKLPPAFGVTEQRWPLALRCPIVADAGRFHCKKPGSKTKQGKESTKESHVQFNLPSQNIYTIFVAPQPKQPQNWICKKLFLHSKSAS